MVLFVFGETEARRVHFFQVSLEPKKSMCIGRQKHEENFSLSKKKKLAIVSTLEK